MIRPSYNSGHGFFVAQGKLYDANGVEFRIRGVNRVHWDSSSAAGIAASGANTVRWNIDFSRPAGGNVALVRSQSIAERIVPIVGNWGATCSNDPARLAALVSTWVQQARAWSSLERSLIVNVANEWGPSNDPVWRDAYVQAIAQLRAAGYLGTILVDSGGCGQDVDDLLHYSGAVFASDPQKNVMFALHIYGRIPRDRVAADLAQLSALSREQGMAFLVGEFGPGRNIGPSPTLTTPEEVISAAEANGIGWLAWAWDDNDRPQGGSDDHWFSMTYHGPGLYGSAADLTEFGREVVLNPHYGLKALAGRASILR
jgi:mannan endo-1,4-beta-mannosidase